MAFAIGYRIVIVDISAAIRIEMCRCGMFSGSMTKWPLHEYYNDDDDDDSLSPHSLLSSILYL